MYGHCGLFRKTLVTSSLAKVAKKIGNILRCFKNNTLKSKTAVTTIWATFYSNILSHFICCDHMDHIVCVSKNCCDHLLGYLWWILGSFLFQHLVTLLTTNDLCLSVFKLFVSMLAVSVSVFLFFLTLYLTSCCYCSGWPDLAKFRHFTTTLKTLAILKGFN